MDTRFVGLGSNTVPGIPKIDQSITLFRGEWHVDKDIQWGFRADFKWTPLVEDSSITPPVPLTTTDVAEFYSFLWGALGPIDPDDNAQRLTFFPRTKSTFATTLNSVNPYDYVSNSEVRIFYKDEPPSNPTFWQFFKRMRERTPVLDGVIFRSGSQTFTDTNPLITCFGKAVRLQAYAQYHIDLANEIVTFEIPVPVKFVDPALNLHNDQVYMDKTGTILTALKPGAYDIEAIFPPGDSPPPKIPNIARVIPTKVEITNKADILYYYPNEVYTTGPTTGSPAPVIANITPPTQTITWLIENDQSGGTSILAGATNTIGILTPTFSGNGFFQIVAKHISIDCRDEQKSSIIDVVEVLNSQTEADYFVTQATLGVNIFALNDIANEAINYAATQTHSNAVRHCYWQALVTMDHRSGFNIAFGWGNAHEKASATGGSGIDNHLDAYDTSADLHNNVIGRSIGQGFQTATSEFDDPVLQANIRNAVLSAVATGIDPTITLDPEVPSNVVRLQ